jgi:nucleotide-binding universal stress UspA family protein
MRLSARPFGAFFAAVQNRACAMAESIMAVVYHRILVATDGSPLAEQAARMAVELARRTEAELVVLCVVPSYTMDQFLGARTSLPNEVARIEQAGELTGRRATAQVRQWAEDAGVPVKEVVQQSDHVAETIEACARKFGCDLIVIGSHGYRGVRQWLLGSETQKILSLSHVAVLVAR